MNKTNKKLIILLLTGFILMTLGMTLLLVGVFTNNEVLVIVSIFVIMTSVILYILAFYEIIKKYLNKDENNNA